MREDEKEANDAPDTHTPNELIEKMEECALAESEQPAEILEEAVRKYLDDRSWVRWMEKNQEHATATGHQRARRG